MRNKINLLTSSEIYKKRAAYTHKFHIISLIAGIIIISCLIVLFVIKYKNTNKIKILEARLDSLNYSLNNKANIQNQKYLKNRLCVIDDIVSNGIKYQEIFDKFYTHFGEYNLSNIEVDKSKEIKFRLSLNNTQELIDFLDKLQTSDYKNYFYNIYIGKIIFPNDKNQSINLNLSAKVK